MKNFVPVGSSRLNQNFLGVRPPTVVRLARVETAYPKIHYLFCLVLGCDTGSPLRTVSFWDTPWGIAMWSVSSFLIRSCPSSCSALAFIGAAVKRRNEGTVTLRVLESRKNRKTSIAGVRHP
jgi:hypothetical protein